jgi:hypothetical protein
VLATSALLLSACAERINPPPGPTDADVSSYLTSILLLRQEASQTHGHLSRPETGPIEYLNFDSSSWSLKMEECLREQGYVEDASDAGGSLKWVSGQQGDTGTRRVEWYECATGSVRSSGQFGVMSMAQRDYLYSYYYRWLVPCFELNGVGVVDPPSREAFVDDPLRNGWWSPYFATKEPLTRAQLDRLITACPAAPSGLVVTG